MRTCLRWIFLHPIVEKYFFRSIFEWLQDVGGVFTFALLNIFAAGWTAGLGGRVNCATLSLKLTESLWILKQVCNKATFIFSFSHRPVVHQSPAGQASSQKHLTHQSFLCCCVHNVQDNLKEIPKTAQSFYLIVIIHLITVSYWLKYVSFDNY